LIIVPKSPRAILWFSRQDGGRERARQAPAGRRGQRWIGAPDLARQLGAGVASVLAEPEVKEKLLAIGLIPVGTTPEELSQELAANTAFWQPIVKASGYRIAN
jgi:hypothetical protein